MGNMNAESMKKSLVPQVGNSVPHLVQDVAVLSTPTVDALSKNQLIVLIALFQSLLDNTNSPDIRYLSAAAAIKRVVPLVDEKEAREIVLKLMGVRQGNILDSLF